MITDIDSFILREEALKITRVLSYENSCSVSVKFLKKGMIYEDFLKELLIENSDIKLSSIIIRKNIFSIEDNTLEEVKLFSSLIADGSNYDKKVIEIVKDLLNEKLDLLVNKDILLLQSWIRKKNKKFNTEFKELECKSFLKNFEKNLNNLKSLVTLVGGESEIPQDFSNKLLKNLIESKLIFSKINFVSFVILATTYPSFAVKLNDIYDLSKNENYKKSIIKNFKDVNKVIVNAIISCPESWQSVYPQIKDKDELAKEYEIETKIKECNNFVFDLDDFLISSGNKARFEDVGRFRAFLIRVINSQKISGNILENIDVGQSQDGNTHLLSLFIEKSDKYSKEQTKDILVFFISTLCEQNITKENLNILMDEYIMLKMTENFTSSKRKLNKF